MSELEIPPLPETTTGNVPDADGGGQMQRAVTKVLSAVGVSDITTDIILSNKARLFLRLLDFIASISVFGVVEASCQNTTGYCFFGASINNQDGDRSSCSFAIFIGVMTMLLNITIVSVMFLPSHGRQIPRWYPFVEFAGSIVWWILLFSNAVNLSTKYNQTCAMYQAFGLRCVDSITQTPAQAVVFFSWYLTINWTIFTTLAFRSWRALKHAAAPPLTSVSVVEEDFLSAAFEPARSSSSSSNTAILPSSNPAAAPIQF